MSSDTHTEQSKGKSTNIWFIVLAIIAIFLLLSAVGGYLFHWTWTGFQGNTLWDWLKLLLLPVALVTAKISFKGHQRMWLTVAIIATVVLAVTGIGGYLLQWKWTGFQGNTLWDWLILLLLPVGLVVVKLSYTEYQQHKQAKSEA
jgi:hypothetical protein